MLGIYFSGTGNSRYALEIFLKEYNDDSLMLSIEEDNFIEKIQKHEELVFSYPVQYSTVPKIVRDFINDNSDIWNGKKVFIIATMGLFSGDGAGILGRLLEHHGAIIVGGIHVKMPDSIADEKVLKRSLEKNIELVAAANQKIKKAVVNIRKGTYPQEGLGVFSHMAGFVGQRLWFGHKTRKYSSRLKIDTSRCVGCSRCVKLCPTQNIGIKDNIAVGNDKCTMCYRCVNHCPKQAITLLGKKVIEQTTIDKYLRQR